MMAEAPARMSSTAMSPVSTISWKARENRKSPTSTLGLLPHIRLAETLPRRSALSSTTSSCRSVAVWMNSTAAGFGSGECQHGPEPLAAGIDQMLGQVGDQRHARTHAGMDQLVGGGHA